LRPPHARQCPHSWTACPTLHHSLAPPISKRASELNTSTAPNAASCIVACFGHFIIHTHVPTTSASSSVAPSARRSLLLVGCHGRNPETACIFASGLPRLPSPTPAPARPAQTTRYPAAAHRCTTTVGPPPPIIPLPHPHLHPHHYHHPPALHPCRPESTTTTTTTRTATTATTTTPPPPPPRLPPVSHRCAPARRPSGQVAAY